MHHLTQISDPLQDQCAITVQQFLVVLFPYPITQVINPLNTTQ